MAIMPRLMAELKRKGALVPIFMEALCNRKAIIFLPCDFFLSSIFLSFFPRRPQIGCLPYFYTWHGRSENLECRSEMCCSRLAANAGPKSRQKSPSGHHPTTLSGYIFATKTCIDNRKKVVKQQYLFHMSSQYGERQPTSG